MTLRHCQLVAAVVFLIFRVALDPVVMHPVLFDEGQKLLPEIHIQGGLFVRPFPAPGHAENEKNNRCDQLRDRGCRCKRRLYKSLRFS